MNNNHTPLDKILYNGLRPWLDSNKPDEKFATLISDIETVYSSFQVLYEIDFYRPFNYKTQFYQKFIINETNAYGNKIVDLINKDENEKLQKYWYSDTLNKKLQTRLKDIGKLIKDKQYEIEYIDPHKTSLEIDVEHKTETYIIQLLKVAFIKIYLEIQEVFKDLESENTFIEDDLYIRFLNEPIPEKSFLKEAPEIINLDSTTIKPQGTQKATFTPILDDNRPLKKGIDSYHNLVRNPQRFGMFEEQLFVNDYINQQYSFIGKLGYKNQLAIIYHVIIEKNYFKGFNDSTKKQITPRDIVKFLSHRYDIDVDKQFRTYKDKVEEKTQFVEANSWIFKLPPS